MKNIVKFIFVSVLFLVAFYFSFIQVRKIFFTKTSKEISKQPDISEPTESKVLTDFFSENVDFESMAANELQKGIAFSGSTSQHFSKQLEYGYAVSHSLSEITNYGKWKKLNCRLKFFAKDALSDVVVVCSIEESDGKSIRWMSEPVEFKTPFEKNKWNDFETSFNIDDISSDQTPLVKTYVWNRGKSNFNVDDMFLQYSGYPNKSLQRTLSFNSSVIHNFEIDFENSAGLVNANTIIDDFSRNGKKSIKLSSSNEYGAGIKKKVSEVSDDSLKDIFVSAWIYPEDEKNDLALVATINSPDGTTKTWQGKSCPNYKFKKHEWQLMNAWLVVSEAKASPDDVVTVYPWNKGKTTLHIDDMTVVFGRPGIKKGNPPNATITMENTVEFKVQKNKPPFENSCLKKLSIKNNDGIFLNNKDSSTAFFHDAKFLSGTFFTNDSKDELALLKNNSLTLFSYCTKENYFKQVFNISKNYFDEKNYLLAGGIFSAGNKYGVVAINKKSGAGYLLQFSKNGDVCSDGKTEMHETKIQTPLRDVYSVPIVFDADHDGKDELLFFDTKSEKWSLYKLNTVFEEIASGKFGSLNIQDINSSTCSAISFNGKNVLVIASSNRSSVFAYNSFAKNFTSIMPENDLRTVVNSGDRFLDAGNNFLIKFNRQQGFEMKVMSVDSKGFTIKSNLDFAGFESDHNPKYYEMVEMISGKFIEAGKNSFLVVSSNCDDANFDGGPCEQLSQLDYLPNKIEVYQLPDNH